jgi:MOSC domain-containing protein YiiM
MGDDDFPRRFADAGRPGAYLRIVEAGHLQAGDPIEVAPGSPPGLPLRAFAPDGLSTDVVERMASDPRVPAVWRDAARRALVE